MVAKLDLNMDGYTDLPPGYLASVVTHLKMDECPVLPPADSSPLQLVPWSSSPEEYLHLFREVGTDWLWFGRLRMHPEKLAATLRDVQVYVYRATAETQIVGLVELDARDFPSVEIAYLGLLPSALNRGLGKWLLNEALRAAWTITPQEVTVHTCTLDHPRALDAYQRAGFRPYRRSIEVVPDPRLAGWLPAHAAPDMPIL
jgi:GNAT superfamily N-acetyltransferase